MTTPCNCGPHECIHPSRLLPDWHCKVAEASRAPLLALVEQFLITLRPIEKSAAWAREYSAKSPSSHQEFIQQAVDNWRSYEQAKADLEAALKP